MCDSTSDFRVVRGAPVKSRDKPARSRSQERMQRSPVARLVGTADVRSCKWSFPCVMLCDSLRLHETIGFGQSPSVPEPGKSRSACGFLKISCQNRNWSADLPYFRSSRPLQLGLAPLFCSPITASVLFGLADCYETARICKADWLDFTKISLYPADVVSDPLVAWPILAACSVTWLL